MNEFSIGNYGRNGSALWLYNNNLTLFESRVFQPVLEQMAVFGYPNAHVDISDSNFLQYTIN